MEYSNPAALWELKTVIWPNSLIFTTMTSHFAGLWHSVRYYPEFHSCFFHRIILSQKSVWALSPDVVIPQFGHYAKSALHPGVLPGGCCEHWISLSFPQKPLWASFIAVTVCSRRCVLPCLLGPLCFCVCLPAIISPRCLPPSHLPVPLSERCGWRRMWPI